MFRVISALVVVGLLFLGINNPVHAEDHGKPPVEELEKQFDQLIELETNKENEVKKYDSIDRLEQEFKSIMVWPLADHYVDTFFEERDGKLIKIARDGPVRLLDNKDYTLEKINENHYKLTQPNENNMRGEYTLTIHYKYEAGKWVFADRMNHVANDSSGGEMPDTATNLPLTMALGSTVMLAGGLLLVARKRVNA
ncbi:LPXTG cell wall anchor domain-containing protein [Guptibacillus algicola]|uniref:LPXTG cell wall anchor domain-containing protein n=1 Tax=Guptibacillus algicola TaxID=225844 RepID=UPI001CD43622|nr:LPXTG cell wall anchor domain-containing protein [Alkalihalobacillus algicola]MCA0988473.1 LPXTG cell wall anchor domain-containing protein [Alkalihalobacillus algicola]